jgi:hypothetical protein
MLGHAGGASTPILALESPRHRTAGGPGKVRDRQRPDRIHAQQTDGRGSPPRRTMTQESSRVIALLPLAAPGTPGGRRPPLLGSADPPNGRNRADSVRPASSGLCGGFPNCVAGSSRVPGVRELPPLCQGPPSRRRELLDRRRPRKATAALLRRPEAALELTDSRRSSSPTRRRRPGSTPPRAAWHPGVPPW